MADSHDTQMRATRTSPLSGEGREPPCGACQERMAETRRVRVPRGTQLHLRLWTGREVPFLLLHGLASNSRMWDLVAEHLHMAGHSVAALDQRGHGCSDQPAGGYDFSTLCGDVAAVLDGLGWERPLVVGQSWGANVALEFGACYGDRAAGLGFVDGGWIDLQGRPGGTWEETRRRLRPPDISGLGWEELEDRIRGENPDWSEEAVMAMMTNYERLPDGTGRRLLPLTQHLEILRHLWQQRPQELYGRVNVPVVLCVAENGQSDRELRRREVVAAETRLHRVATHWFAGTSHDIHVHRPLRLAWTLLREIEDGIWNQPSR